MMLYISALSVLPRVVFALPHFK